MCTRCACAYHFASLVHRCCDLLPPCDIVVKSRCDIAHISHPGVGNRNSTIQLLYVVTCYLGSFTSGRFFGLVLLFASASVYSRVRVRLLWFGFVCLHRLMNSGKVMNLTEATVINMLLFLHRPWFVVRCLEWFCFIDFPIMQQKALVRVCFLCICLIMLCCLL
jgi:hypothetical protein